MTQHRSGELKQRAWLAKQRLKMGYWDSLKAGDRDGEYDVRPAPRQNIVIDTAQKADVRDELMYRKVCAMLDRDEATLNPIGQLIEDDVYSKLDPASKQRYILELSNKFRELKERYYKERTGA